MDKQPEPRPETLLRAEVSIPVAERRAEFLRREESIVGWAVVGMREA